MPLSDVDRQLIQVLRGHGRSAPQAQMMTLRSFFGLIWIKDDGRLALCH
jgi:hypothetical protein